MPRWLVALIVALLIPCYGFAAVGKSVALVLDDTGHALAHYANEAHHHDDDGAMHADGSDESMTHPHGDDWVSTPALLVHSMAVTFPAPADAMPRLASASETPPPFLEGPIRPPRSDLRPC
jgi:hypothetical protein